MFLQKIPKITYVFLLSIFFATAFFSTLDAAINQEINYQARLLDSAGDPVADGNYSIEFNLYTVASGGSSIWTETQSVPVEGGLFATFLGSSTPLTTVDFNQTLYLGVDIEADGEMTPRKKLGAVSAAIVSDTVDGIDSGQFFRNDIVNATSTATTSLAVRQNGVGDVADFIGSTGTSALRVASDGTVQLGSSSRVFVQNGNVEFEDNIRVGSLNSSAEVLIGDLSGNVRGTRSIDIQSYRTSATMVASGNYTTAIGYSNIGSGDFATVIGRLNTASGDTTTVIGSANIASQVAATAVGSNNTSSGTHSATFGRENTASATQSTSLGYGNSAMSSYASAIGYSNSAPSIYASAFGYDNNAAASDASAFGARNAATSDRASALGYANTGQNENASAVGNSNDAGGSDSSAFGFGNTTTASDTSAFGAYNSASNQSASAFGYSNSSSGSRSSAFGYSNISSATYSSAFGYDNDARGSYSSAFGYSNYANSSYATALGVDNDARGNFSIAVGYSNYAGVSGQRSSLFGYNNTTGSLVDDSYVFGGGNTATVDSAGIVGRNITNSISDSLMLGPSNTAKATILSDGEFQANYFTATSTTATSTLPELTTTNAFVSGLLDIAPTTATTTGVIAQGGSPVFHTYGNGNLFAGGAAPGFGLGFAGNFYLTNIGNTGIGTAALSNLTSGSLNTAIGVGSLKSNTSGFSNTAFGYNALAGNLSGGNNLAIGNSAGDNLTTGSQNILIGNGIDAQTSSISNTLNIGNILFGTGVDGTGTTISSGNIGIGTTSPTDLFTVAGLLDSYVAIQSASDDPLSSGAGIKLTDYFGTNPFYVSVQNNGEFRIKADNGGYIKLQNNANNYANVTKIVADEAGTITAPSIALSLTSTDETGFYLPATNNIGFITDRLERARIDEDGNFGIGTTSPTSALSVVGDTYLDGILSVFPKYDTDSYYASSSVVVGPNDSTFGDVTVSLGSDLNNDSRIAFFEDTTMQWETTVQGSSNRYFIADSDGSNGVFLDQDASSWTGFSDARLKENIEEYSVLDRIDDFRGVTFDWKSTGNRDIGVVAQELNEVFPELVSPGSGGNLDDTSIMQEGVWGVVYDKMGALALQGLKELKAMVVDLSVRVDELAKNTIASVFGWMEFKNEELCVDDVCIDKEQFKALLENNGATVGNEFNDIIDLEDDVVSGPVSTTTEITATSSDDTIIDGITTPTSSTSTVIMSEEDTGTTTESVTIEDTAIDSSSENSEPEPEPEQNDEVVAAEVSEEPVTEEVSEPEPEVVEEVVEEEPEPEVVEEPEEEATDDAV